MNRSILACIALALFFTPITTAKVVEIIDEDQYNQELKGHDKMLVEFSADWCSVCNGINKPFREIADEAEFQHVAFAQVDVDKLDNVSKQNGIVGVPTFVYVENGSKKVEEIGVQNMPAFKEHLRDNLRKTFKVAQNDAKMDFDAPRVDEIMDEAAAQIDIEAPAAPPAAEPNFFVKILNGIKDLIILILSKIKDFFMTIVDAIRGFFGG